MKRKAEIIYIEIDDMYKTNKIIENLKVKIGPEFSYTIVPPKSGFQGNLGINIVLKKSSDFDESELCKSENIVYIEKE